MVVERGMLQAGVSSIPRHPDIKDAGGIPTLLVQLDDKGKVESLRPVPPHVTPWTLRDGQHNSFPFVKLIGPLWVVPQNPQNDLWLASVLNKKNPDRRRAFLDRVTDSPFDLQAYVNWPGAGLFKRLRERRRQLATLDGTESDVVVASLDYFLLACDQGQGNGAQKLLQQVAERIIIELQYSSQDYWLETAIALLMGTFNKKDKEWKSRGALLFESSGKSLSILDPKLISSVSDALSDATNKVGNVQSHTIGTCALTGTEGRLLSGNSPQPNLKILGQTYLFAKNRDIPANDRYGRFSTNAMPVSLNKVIDLAAALVALTSDDRRNITWRGIPGEIPKQSDLLLAFVEDIPNAWVTESLAEEDYSHEESELTSNTVDSVAAFEKRTQRMIELIKAKVGSDVTTTPVHITVFRKVDPANRKVVYADTLSVAELYRAATTWVEGERNVPEWLKLPILIKGDRKLRLVPPLHLSPLGLIAFSREAYIRGGTERQEVVGLNAADTMRLFLAPIKVGRRLAERVLRVVLTRRAVLLAGVAHSQHTPQSSERRTEIVKKFDRTEALRTITLLGLLLHKLSREKEVYMQGTAFKLGQLLAAADIVHAGYCADVRGGAVPPALLGNQVFAMAQAAPVKALATLCRRWKPYAGWARKVASESTRTESLVTSSNRGEQQRGWDIKKALRQARMMGGLASELAPALINCPVNDAFRAELLLGYIAGLPKSQKDDADMKETNSQQED